MGPDTATATGGLHGTARQRQRTAAAMVLLNSDFDQARQRQEQDQSWADLKEEEERRAALDAAWHVVSTHAGGVIAQRVGV